MSVSDKTIERIIECLAEAKDGGMLTCEIQRATGYNLGHISTALLICANDKRIGWHPEPAGRTHNRRRWFHPDHRPEVHVPMREQTTDNGRFKTVMRNGVKVTQAISRPDARYSTEAAQPYFSAMAMGSYPPSGSAIGRVYGAD